MKAQEATPARPGKPKKGVTPIFAGVPAALVADEGLELEFGTNRRISPYDAPLKQLAEAGPGKLLRLEDTRARVSLKVRANKLGLRIAFAEQGKTLFVKLLGRVDDDIRGTRRERIRAAVKVGPRSAGELLNVLREKGDATADLQILDLILSQLVRDGDIVRQEGGRYSASAALRQRLAATA